VKIVSAVSSPSAYVRKHAVTLTLD